MLQPSQIAPERLRPLKRVEYDRLVALGMFEGNRVELIRGSHSIGDIVRPAAFPDIIVPVAVLFE